MGEGDAGHVYGSEGRSLRSKGQAVCGRGGRLTGAFEGCEKEGGDCQEKKLLKLKFGICFIKVLLFQYLHSHLTACVFCRTR